MKSELIAATKRMLPANIKYFLKWALLLNTPEQLRLLKLENADYSHLPLSAKTETSINKVKEASKLIYGDNWNYYSNALRREVVHVFETCIRRLSSPGRAIEYLEIGSNQGLSMSIIAKLMSNEDSLGRLVSVDPYYDEGYIEGTLGPWKKALEIKINKETRDNAQKLYRLLNLRVELIEKKSSEALKELIHSSRRFNLIYIDGSHEGLNPLIDFALSYQLLAPNGIIVIDDYHWPDVKVVKELCDRHCNKIAESSKLAAYEIVV